MKFIKQNLTLVIVGAVILLAIVSVFYPTGSLKAALQKTMEERMATETSIQRRKNTEIKIPGVETAYKGVPSDKMVQARQKAIDYMKDQSAKVVEVGARQNKQGRVDDKGVPLFMGQPQRGYLPKINGVSAMAFKDTYAAIFPMLMLQLTGTDKMPSMPPSDQELRTAFEEQRRQREAARPAGAAPLVDDARQFLEFQRSQVMGRAAGLHMYVDNGALQQRGWAYAESAPSEENIFNGIVDSWIQGDIVRAIEQTNNAAFQKNPAGPKNVGAAAVKRLMRITVGNESQGSRLGLFDSLNTAISGTNVVNYAGPGTNLFFIPAAAQGSDANAAAAAGNQPNTPDFARNLTGRASGSEFDVVLLQVCVDIDPAWLNRFVDQIYRQNMGYTVLNLRMKAVDPLSRSSMGFIYGDTQVIEAEITLEALLFRDWTRPIMPEKIRVALGLPPEEPAAAPANQ
jgi:hypothetical protein